ncbi:MAG TPA: sulfurtransferase [Nitrolancea sp.]|nr:sulfurtransferase [Nitrolancea sp.]
MFALLLLMLAAPACQQSSPPIAATGTEYRPDQYPAGHLLVTVDWLAAHLDDPSIRIIDLSPLADYRSGHIPGARHAWWQDTIEVHNDTYGMLVNEEGRAKLIREAGITPDTKVVLYDASGGRYAARILWMLNAIGFDRAAILNGGRQAWQAAGHALVRDAPSIAPGALEQRLNYDVLISADDLHARLDDASIAIVDNRTLEEQRETWFGQLRTGRIPGAVIIPATDMVQSGPIPYYADPQHLRQRFLDSGITPEKTVVVYGQHGSLAAQTYVALRLLGYPSVKVYDGSWAEWGAKDDLPIEPLPSQAGGR